MCLADDLGKEHLGTPLKFANEPAQLSLRAPDHGEHVGTILGELGYDASAVEALRSAGIV
jgi:crotonobetainyl-CoA:carnitine CoA-transferase CaiB-like acyl-CoA transferase